MPTQTPQKPESSPPAKRPTPVTPYTLTLLLAYLHYYTPEFLSRGHFIAPSHLRVMAEWIGLPAPHLRSIRQHPFLAAHMTLLRAAGFISSSGPRLIPLPPASAWLHAAPADQLRRLLATLQDTTPWQNALSALGLQEVLTEDLTAYVTQLLERQIAALSVEETGVISWLSDSIDEVWRLHLPKSLPLWLHFDLRQLGSWSPGNPLVCTPLSIATAAQRGYAQAVVQWLLETAAGQPLTPARQKQLTLWVRRANAFQVQTVHLLTTAQHQQLKTILRQKRLRESVVTQLSPRHAVVATDMLPKLEKWLAAQAYPLQKPEINSTAQKSESEKSAEFHWLGLRLLVGLGDLLPLPYPAPHALLEDAAQALAPETLTDLEHLAQQTITSLREAIRGRDAFFPAEQPVPDAWLEIVRQAIYNQTPLTLYYQPLGDLKPSWREVQPLRLEQRGALYYLHVYCYRAEANLTLRLDRVHDIQE